MNISTHDELSGQICQARGVLAALLADLSDVRRGSHLTAEMQSNALWAVDSLLERSEETLRTGIQTDQCLPK